MFQVLGAINPRWWLPQLLNKAPGAERFRQQVYRKFQIDLWVNQPQYPKGLLPWNEGSTQVDAVIRWENPPTTIYCEMKYLADLSPTTTGGQQQAEFPSDQLIRNIRVGLWRTGWFHELRLFKETPRDFAVVVIGPSSGHELISRYRKTMSLYKAIPNSNRLLGLPPRSCSGK